MQMPLDHKIISDELLKNAPDVVAANQRYAYSFLPSIIKEYPYNTSPSIIAMKVAVVNLEDSTSLSQQLRYDERRKLNLKDLVDKIQEIGFDERVRLGDWSLVSELSSWSKNRGLNLFSFFSKYACYHNRYFYDRDDYSIFDNVVAKNIGDYLSLADWQGYFGQDFRLRHNQKISLAVFNKIEQYRTNSEYEKWCGLTGYVCDKYEITRKNKRSEMDHLIWYENR